MSEKSSHLVRGGSKGRGKSESQILWREDSSCQEKNCFLSKKGHAGHERPFVWNSGRALISCWMLWFSTFQTRARLCGESTACCFIACRSIWREAGESVGWLSRKGVVSLRICIEIRRLISYTRVFGHCCSMRSIKERAAARWEAERSGWLLCASARA